jgi:hypothetical protein
MSGWGGHPQPTTLSPKKTAVSPVSRRIVSMTGFVWMTGSTPYTNPPGARLHRRGHPGAARRPLTWKRIAAGFDRTYCLSEVDIFADLSETEMSAIAAAAPMKTYAAGQLLFFPLNRVECLFILKKGRVRIFRIAADGRALTTALITPGTIFGEMVLLGQHMYDNYAEALDEAVVCVMTRSDVQQYLLSDARIATRITEILGQRLVEMERRLCDGKITILDPAGLAAEAGD